MCRFDYLIAMVAMTEDRAAICLVFSAFFSEKFEIMFPIFAMLHYHVASVRTPQITQGAKATA